MRSFDTLTQVLLIVGGLNWLLVGLFQFDLVAAIFGGQTAGLSRVVYVLVGLCALYQIIRLPAMLETNRLVTATATPAHRPDDTL